MTEQEQAAVPAVQWNRAQAMKDYVWAQANIATVHASMAGYQNYPVERMLSAGAAAVVVERERQSFALGHNSASDEVANPAGQLVRAAQWHLNLSEGEYPYLGNGDFTIYGKFPDTVALLKAATFIVAEIDRRIANGSAFVCDRCGSLRDGAPEVRQGRGKSKLLKLGEKAICKACAEESK